METEVVIKMKEESKRLKMERIIDTIHDTVQIIEDMSGSLLVLKKNNVRFRDSISQSFSELRMEGDRAIYQVNLILGDYEINITNNVGPAGHHHINGYPFISKESEWVLTEKDGKVLHQNKYSTGGLGYKRKIFTQEDLWVSNLILLNHNFGNLRPVTSRSFAEWNKDPSLENDLYTALRLLQRESGERLVPYIQTLEGINEMVDGAKVIDLENTLANYFAMFESENFKTSELKHARHEEKILLERAKRRGVYHNKDVSLQDKLYNPETTGCIGGDYSDYMYCIIPVSSGERVEQTKSTRDRINILHMCNYLREGIIEDLSKEGFGNSLFIATRNYPTAGRILETYQIDLLLFGENKDYIKLNHIIKKYKEVTGKDLLCDTEDFGDVQYWIKNIKRIE